ncbi:MAG: ABC transporter ATP-binding protein [Lentisphaerae bacterium]|jgi:ABC-2 type transport system ATP-binding protein|nr:ABC transporter ATP-binding protein [Lentisphaerota bacterium]
MIEIRQLSKIFSKRPVLNEITFTAGQGERVALLGANGAGKTTLLRVLATYLPASSGFGKIAGFDLFSDSLSIRAITGYLPEGVPLYNDMRVAEYLKFRGRLRNMEGQLIRKRMHDVIAACDLASWRLSRIGSLSAGLRHRVGLADAMLHEPRILLLDDPIADCDPYQTEKITSILADAEEGTQRTLIFTTHSSEIVLSIATRIIFMERGQIIADTHEVASLKNKTLATMFGKWKKEFESSMEKSEK